MLVEELGGECRVAYDGNSGVHEVLSYRPEIVLLDIGMPGLDGCETCSRIRRELGRGVIVVASTGFGQAELRRARSIACRPQGSRASRCLCSLLDFDSSGNFAGVSLDDVLVED